MGKVSERMAKLATERIEVPKDPLHGKYVVGVHTALDHLSDKFAEIEDWIVDQSGLDTWELAKLDPEVRKASDELHEYDALVSDMRKTIRVWRSQLLALSRKVK